MKTEQMDQLFLETPTARRLYRDIAAALPIIDYHCHLPPREICQDEPFDNIGQVWLADDHYKWRLMRIYGVDENYITGDASWHDKFLQYARTIQNAIGNPIYYWTHMELRQYFKIDTPLTAETAEDIWQRANAYIKESGMSPRSLIRASRVEYIATTDDPLDSLEYHRALRDEGFQATVTPSFRADNLLLLNRGDFADYAARLSRLTRIPIRTIEDYESALCARLDHFRENGCRFADVGIEFFPKTTGTAADAEYALRMALGGESVPMEKYHPFLWYMYLVLAKACKARGIVLQMHIAVKRNPNTRIYRAQGPDRGADCIGEQIAYENIIRLLDAMDSSDGLPETIIYNLNPAMTYAIATIAGAYRDVRCGAAWWFCDHRRGIEEHIQTLAETGHLARFLGMLTDSRSFLSYARHDYFRRILCGIFADWIDKGLVLDGKSGVRLLKAICYENVNHLVYQKQEGIS